MTGEVLLGRLGVVLMLSVWCLAVGFAFLCLRGERGARPAMASFLVPLVLVLPTPYLVPVFLITSCATSIVMFPATHLVAVRTDTNTRRGLAALVVGLAALALSPSLPDKWWLSIPVVAIAAFAPPIGLLLLSERLVRGHRWRAAACSMTLFVLSWSMWMGRAYFYRPNES